MIDPIATTSPPPRDIVDSGKTFRKVNFTFSPKKKIPSKLMDGNL